MEDKDPHTILVRLIEKYGRVEIRRKMHSYLVIYPLPLEEKTDDNDGESCVCGPTIDQALKNAWHDEIDDSASSEIIEEPDEPENCDECGFPPKQGNIVYLSNGKRPLCQKCNPDKYTWLCGPCGNRLPKLMPKPAKCWFCLTGTDPLKYLSRVKSGEICEECGHKPKAGNVAIFFNGTQLTCSLCSTK